jgi:hypothetical protein
MLPQSLKRLPRIIIAYPNQEPDWVWALEAARFAAKKYKEPFFKVCKGDAGDECYEESVTK